MPLGTLTAEDTIVGHLPETDFPWKGKDGSTASQDADKEALNKDKEKDALNQKHNFKQELMNEDAQEQIIRHHTQRDKIKDTLRADREEEKQKSDQQKDAEKEPQKEENRKGADTWAREDKLNDNTHETRLVNVIVASAEELTQRNAAESSSLGLVDTKQQDMTVSGKLCGNLVLSSLSLTMV